jgi:multiple sugar transport system substrate-binding protein
MFPGPEKANINWKQFSGQSIRWLGGQHPVSETLIKMAPAFEELTGIKVNVEQVDWNAFDSKRKLDIASKTPQYDTYMAMFWDDWLFGSQNLLADQNTYLNDPKLTDKEWLALDDISKPLQESAIWDGTAGHPVGEGKRFSIPYMIETYILAYRSDILDKAGVKLDKPVAIMEDMPGIVEKIKASDKSVVPIAYRGSGGSINAVWMSFLPNYGGGDFDKGMNSRWSEDVMVKLMDTVINKIAKPYGPPGWPTLSWDDLRHKFANGDYAMVYDCDFFSTLYEEDPTSKIKGQLKYQLVGGPSSQLSCTYYFGNSIAQNSQKKEAAWLFNEWVISKMGQRDWAVKYKNLIPTRQSVWSDPDLMKWVGGWGGGTWLDCVKQNVTKNVKIFMTPFADYGSVVTELESAVAAVYNGKAPAQAAKDLATKVNAITDKAKVRKPDVH